MCDSPSTMCSLQATMDTANAGILGKELRIAVHLEGCKGLPQATTRQHYPNGRLSFGVTFQTISRAGAPWVNSTMSQEGERTFGGTVHWDETLHLNCLEISMVCVALYTKDSRGVSRRLYEASLTPANLLTKTELLLLPLNHNHFDTSCTLYITTSRAFDQHEERVRQRSHHDNSTAAEDSPLDGEADIRCADAVTASDEGPWNTLLRQLPVFVDVAERLKVFTRGYWIFWELYDTYRTCTGRGLQLHHIKLGVLITSLVTAIDTILTSVHYAYAHRKRADVSAVFDQIWYSANLILNCIHDEIHLSMGHRYFSDQPKYGPQGANVETIVELHGTELSRLTWVIMTPDPTSGVGSAAARTDRCIIERAITKDALVFALEAVVRSSDAFPPLKSAANGLLFIATCAELACGNKRQICDIYKRIDALAASLKRGGCVDGVPLPSVFQDALSTLAGDIETVNKDLYKIVVERKSCFKRHFCAKRHCEELGQIMTQLEIARSNYMTAIATLNTTTIAQVLAHVKALTSIAGVRPDFLPHTAFSNTRMLADMLST